MNFTRGLLFHYFMNMCMFWTFITPVLLLPSITSAAPSRACPTTFSSSGFVNDLGLLTDAVSWDNSTIVQGVCAQYTQIYERHGKYDTRLRVYQSNETSQTIFSFRPTQQTPEGGSIHNQRRVAACRFINGSCFGLVNDRFQQAFQDLVQDLDGSFYDHIRTQKVSTVGHSLGGALQLFMAIFLKEQQNIQPEYVLGFAGPFIGDQLFTESYQEPLKEKVGSNMWQIETVDLQNGGNYDGTVEGYNVNNGDGAPDWSVSPLNPLSPFRPAVPVGQSIRTPIFIQEDDICGLWIQPVQDSYGMHDLKNYRLALQGTEC